MDKTKAGTELWDTLYYSILLDIVVQGVSLILTKCNGLSLCPESIYRAMKGVKISVTG